MKRLTANLLLALCSASWGLAYPLIEICNREISTFTLLFYRFLFAVLILVAVLYPRLKHINRGLIKYSMISGVFVALLLIFVILSVKYTTSATAGFILGSAVALVIIIDAIIKRKLPKIPVIIGVCLILFGVGMLSMGKDGLTFNSGAIVAVIGAIIYAVYIHIVNYLTPKVDAINFGTYQLFITVFVGLACMLIFEPVVNPLTWSVNAWLSLLGLSAICTSFCFLLQSTAQKYSTALDTGLIFTIEPVSAALYSAWILGEELTINTFIGGGLIVFGIIISILYTHHKAKNQVESKNTLKSSK